MFLLLPFFIIDNIAYRNLAEGSFTLVGIHFHAPVKGAHDKADNSVIPFRL